MADKLRLQVYRDPTGEFEYYCYTLPEKKLADKAWSIERLQRDTITGDLLARHYAMIPGETSHVFMFPATNLATVAALPYNVA